MFLVFDEIVCWPEPILVTVSQLFESAAETMPPSTSATGLVAPGAGIITVAMTSPGTLTEI